MHDDIIEHVSEDAGYNRGYKDGVRHTQQKMHGCDDAGYTRGHKEGTQQAQQQMLKLMDQVVNAYRYKELKMESRDARECRDKLVAVQFMKQYVMSGGATDEDGNIVCVPR